MENGMLTNVPSHNTVGVKQRKGDLTCSMYAAVGTGSASAMLSWRTCTDTCRRHGIEIRDLTHAARTNRDATCAAVKQ